MSKFDESLAKAFLIKFETKAQMKDWAHVFFELDLPDSYVDPESNSSPIDWMFDTYKIYETNKGNEAPSIITVSSRESYKTITEAMLAVMLMVHFGATVCHMAAIVSQATAAQKYIANFTRKIEPYLQYHKKELHSESSKEISIKNEDGSLSWMKIVVCTLAGANSSHSNLLFLDEIDTIRSQEGLRAYKEAAFIPGVFGGQHPLTVKTSTMKFPGGLFSKEMEIAKKEKWPIHKWNIIDITEYCQPERHRPDLPKEIRLVKNSLPLVTLTEQQYGELTDKEQEGFTKLETMGGCANCPLLPVCRERLSKRSPNDKGGLWKPLDFTISQFKKTDPDLAESQLMCWKPSSQGMVYPRFLNKEDGTGNTYTLYQAWEIFTGTPASKNMTIGDLTKAMLSAGIKFYCGVDWGHSHAFAIIVTAILPNKEWWIMDTYSVPGLEFEQMMSLAIQVRDLYGRPEKWYCDTAQPMFIKAFKRNKMPCPAFTKDVRGGIESVRGQIMDAMSNRKLKVIKHGRNEMALRVFAEHTFKLDSNGNITDEPDDSDVADVADALRYAGQNMFGPKGKVQAPSMPSYQQNIPYGNRMQNQNSQVYNDWMSQKIRELSGGNTGTEKGKASGGAVIYDFSDPLDPNDENS